MKKIISKVDTPLKRKVLMGKVVAAQKGYATGKKLAALTADKYGHVFKVDGEYFTEEFTAATELVKACREQLPKLDRGTVTHAGYEEEEPVNERWQSIPWVWLPVPGISRAVQVRTKEHGWTLEFRAASKGTIEAVAALIEARAEQLRTTSGVKVHDPFDEYTAQTTIFGWDQQHKEWRVRSHRASRSFRSVILPAEMQEEIVADLTSFTESKARLVRLELPWRRGYLLSGPPGTGKTSLSLAIAGTLSFNLYSLSLTDIESDGMLRQAVGSLRANSVLVIEDIDAYSVSHDRDHNAARDGKLSLSGLLNSLDGFETPNGLVTVVTTNHADRLDPALVRSGRLDRMFHLGTMQKAGIERLFTWFYEEVPPSPLPDSVDEAELSPAFVTELFKQNFNDPAAGWQALLKAAEIEEVVEPVIGFRMELTAV